MDRTAAVDAALTPPPIPLLCRAFDASLEQHFVLDPAGCFVYANPALLAQWQKARDQGPGRGLAGLGYSLEVLEDVHDALRVLSAERRSLKVRMDSPGGRVGISAALERGAAAAAAELVLTVSDSDVGIAADMLPRVFDLLTQAGESGQGRNSCQPRRQGLTRISPSRRIRPGWLR